MSNIASLSSIVNKEIKTSGTNKSIILLHTRALRDEEWLALRQKFSVVIEWDAKLYASSTPATIVSPPSVFDVFVLPIYEPEALSWYSANATLIHNAGINVVLLRRSGENKAKLSTYNAKSMIKAIPLDANSTDEFVRKLLATYMPAVQKCGMKLFLSWFKC